MASPVLAPTVSAASAPMWRVEGPTHNEAHSSGVSWAAVFAGAFVAAALSLILLALGTGLGFESVSPWANQGAFASAVGKSAIIWLIVMQIIAASMGGYLAGRLRTKWANIHTDEVYFRDTAHGFLVWAVGLVITAAFLASAAAAMLGGAARGGSAAVGLAAGAAGMASGEGQGRNLDPNAYFIDAMLRPTAIANSANNAAPVSGGAANTTAAKSAATPRSFDASNGTPRDLEASNAALHSEVAVIFANDLRQGDLAAEDKTYLGQIVAARTGISESDAEQRVANAFTQIQQAADTARKTMAHTSLWIFLALLIGAFCASLAATWGGAQRDRVVVI